MPTSSRSGCGNGHPASPVPSASIPEGFPAGSLPDRAAGCLLGLAIGDAIGVVSEGKLPEQVRREHGIIRDFVDPKVSGTDDTEFATLTAHVLLVCHGQLTPDRVAGEWLAHLDPNRAYGDSEKMAIVNLARGLRPPVSGSDHQRHWSDGAAMRSAPFGIVWAGDPVTAARMAAQDAQVSHAGDGIYSAQALAAAVAAAMGGRSVEGVLEAALAVLPECWTRRRIELAQRCVEGCTNVFDAVQPLFEGLILREPDGRVVNSVFDEAPEAVAAALAFFRVADGDPNQAVLGGPNLGRDADTIAAMAGAVSGAMRGWRALRPDWVAKVRVTRGVIIPDMGGQDLVQVAHDLAGLAIELGAGR